METSEGLLRGRVEDFRHRFMSPVVRALARTGLTPNAVTIAGFLVSLITAWVLATGHLLEGGILVLLGGGFDLLDGELARTTGRVTPFGALLDSTLDRLSEAAILLGLLLFYLELSSALGVILVYLTLGGSLLVSYIRARAEGLGLKGEAGLLTRPVRVILLAIGLLLGEVMVALWFLVIFTYITAAQRLFYVWRQLRSNSSR